MANLPLDPIFAHLLLKSHELRCVSEVVTAVSLLSADNVFLQVGDPPLVYVIIYTLSLAPRRTLALIYAHSLPQSHSHTR